MPDEESVAYDRDDWKHWIDEDDDCQDTRNEVLIAESEVEVEFRTEQRCQVASGRWTCPYTGEVFTDPSKLHIDHFVPLKNAHISGGDSWDAEKRRKFANDLSDKYHLVAVSASANLSKGARGPEEWLPPLESYRCEYVATWVAIKGKWVLRPSADEENAIEEATQLCDAGQSPPLPQRSN